MFMEIRGGGVKTLMRLVLNIKPLGILPVVQAVSLRDNPSEVRS